VSVVFKQNILLPEQNESASLKLLFTSVQWWAQIESCLQ